MGTSGTLINMVTRSGTNQLSGQAGGTYQGKKTQWDNVDETLKQAGFRPEAQAVDYISNANFQTGGPLLKNRLFYFGNVNNQQTHVNVPGYPAISPPQIPQITSGNDRDSTEIWSGSGKLNYQLGAGEPFRGLRELPVVRQAEPRRRAHGHARLEHEGRRHLPDLAGVVEHGRHQPTRRRHESRLQQHALPAGPEDRPADDPRQLHRRAPPQCRAERADVPPAGAGHLELELLRAGALQRTSRVQVRLRSRLHARGRDDDARGQRQPDVAQRAGHRGAARRPWQCHHLQLADGRQARGHQHGVLRAGLVRDRPAESHRRRPLRAGRGLHPAADARVEPVLPERHDHQRPERRPQHRRHAHHLRRARIRSTR